jgi:hypothetical protein
MRAFLLTLFLFRANAQVPDFSAYETKLLDTCGPEEMTYDECQAASVAIEARLGSPWTDFKVYTISSGESVNLNDRPDGCSYLIDSYTVKISFVDPTYRQYIRTLDELVTSAPDCGSATGTCLCKKPALQAAQLALQAAVVAAQSAQQAANGFRLDAEAAADNAQAAPFATAAAAAAQDAQDAADNALAQAQIVVDNNGDGLAAFQSAQSAMQAAAAAAVQAVQAAQAAATPSPAEAAIQAVQAALQLQGLDKPTQREVLKTVYNGVDCS